MRGSPDSQVDLGWQMKQVQNICLLGFGEVGRTLPRI